MLISQRKRLILPRRAILAGLCATILTSRKARSWIHGQPLPFSPAPINPVTGQRWPDGGNTGYQNEPNFNTSANALIAGVAHARLPGTLVPHPGNGANIFVTPGTYRYILFDTGANGSTNITLSGGGPGTYTFIGCQFCQTSPGGNSAGTIVISEGTCTFNYCSVTPRPALITTPVNGGGYTLWPSGGAQQPDSAAGSATYNNYCIPVADGYQYSVTFESGGTGATFNNCDFWGGTNFINIDNATASNPLTINACWIHDACNDNIAAGPQNEAHVDGIGTESAGGAMSNITITNCTVASIGNTQGLAWQPGLGVSYANMTWTGNYLSGFGVSFALNSTFANYTGSKITNNVFGTDIGTTDFVGGGSLATITNPNCNWRQNVIRIVPGTVPSGTNGIGSNMTNSWNSGMASAAGSPFGYYVYPDDTLNATDYTG